MNASNDFIRGLLTALAMTVATFFLRFWRRGGDRLFAFFSAGFFLLGAHWLALAVIAPERDSEHVFYGMRLVAFGLIIVGVIDKNRSQR